MAGSSPLCSALEKNKIHNRNCFGISYILFPPYDKFHSILNLLFNHKKIFGINLPFSQPLRRLEPSLSLATVMELFQELVFTISFSLIVSLLIAKLFSISSSCDDGNSTLSMIKVEEKIEKEWVVCDSEKEGKAGCFQDPAQVIEEVAFRCVEGELSSGVVIEEPESVGGGVTAVDCYVFDESPERTESNDAGVSLVKSDEDNVVEPVLGCDTGSLILEDRVKSIEVQQETSAIDDVEMKLEEKDEISDDDWQGIETTELEKSFGAAVAFMDSKGGADRVNMIDNEVKLQLYGLHRVAIEGSCFEPQPMALKVSARANWNAWKRLENLGREDAMEQYIGLLSRHVPEWMGTHASEKQ